MQAPDILNSTNVSLENPLFSGLLKDLQGNILKHHGRTHAYHIFLHFNEDEIRAAREWIVQFASVITTAEKQLTDARARETDPEYDGGTFFNLLLSVKGYNVLGVSTPHTPADAAFRAGLQNRTGITADDTDLWESGFKDEIHAIIIVADSNSSTAAKNKDIILAQVAVFANVLLVQKGKVLRNEHGIGIEHFGYADGVSQPNFLIHNDSPATQWEDNNALLNTLLVREPVAGDQLSFGSYFVFRKLEQNVGKFKNSEKDLSKQFNKESDEVFGIFDKHKKQNDELAGAMIVGRFEDGTEVINHSNEKGIIKDSQLNNDFDYRDDAPGSTTNGSKCPFHAHIRITNPRADVGEFAKTVRITRRGIPFNDIGRDEFDLENDQPDGGVGLLFMCYQSSIENQFEFIQHRWANLGDIGGRPVGQDAIIGQGANATVKSLPQQWGIDANKRDVPATFRDFVTMRGGEYFFTPSISFLKGI
ncbi:MAG TPA: Dyp-type peroxidase [Panacibacter sp.]|nr:Dyp-type peroxidase [Panacibacter sp.]